MMKLPLATTENKMVHMQSCKWNFCIPKISMFPFCLLLNEGFGVPTSYLALNKAAEESWQS